MTATAAPSRERGRLLGVLLLLAAVAGGIALWRRSDPRPARHEAGAQVLDEEVVLGAEPLVRRLRVVGPALLTVEAEGAPKGTVGSLGPAAPIEQGEAPDAARATTWETGGATGPRTLPVYGTGLFVLRLAAPAGSAQARVRLRVTRAEGP